MRAEIRTPVSRSAARQAGMPHTWRKKVLPVGDVEYKGRTLRFTPEYLKSLAGSFYAGAYDQVPFQIADAQNTHTNDPERYRGEIVKVDVEPDGLYITAKTTPEGSRLLATNPRLGVSARIIEGYDRSDGQHFDYALQHVLGTLDPRIPGLGAWEAVEMSNRPEVVIDLSDATLFAEEEGGSLMPNLDDTQQARLARLLELDPDKLEAILGAAGDEADDTDEELSDDEIAALVESMDDADFADLLSEYDVGDLLAEEEGEPVLAGLSNDYGLSQIELAEYRIAENERQMRVMQDRMDTQAFEGERRKLADLGIPPFITDLARPLLEGSGHVVEMANGQGVDAGQVMRRVLVELAKQVQLLDLSGEIGSSVDEPDHSEQAATARRDFVSRYKAVTGLG